MWILFGSTIVLVMLMVTIVYIIILNRRRSWLFKSYDQKLLFWTLAFCCTASISILFHCFTIAVVFNNTNNLPLTGVLVSTVLCSLILGILFFAKRQKRLMSIASGERVQKDTKPNSNRSSNNRKNSTNNSEYQYLSEQQSDFFFRVIYMFAMGISCIMTFLVFIIELTKWVPEYFIYVYLLIVYAFLICSTYIGGLQIDMYLLLIKQKGSMNINSMEEEDMKKYNNIIKRIKS